MLLRGGQSVAGAGGTAKWLQLALAVGAMVAVAPVQETWSLFVGSLVARLGGGPTALVQVQSAFSVFVVLQTLAVPTAGALADRHPPSVLLVLASVLFGGGWWWSVSPLSNRPSHHAAAAYCIARAAYPHCHLV
jgi:hypothetical protein